MFLRYLSYNNNFIIRYVESHGRRGFQVASMIGIWDVFVLSSGSIYVCRVDTCFLCIYLYFGFTKFFWRALKFFDMRLGSYAAWD